MELTGGKWRETKHLLIVTPSAWAAAGASKYFNQELLLKGGGVLAAAAFASHAPLSVLLGAAGGKGAAAVP